MVVQAELTSHLMLGCGILEIAEQLGERAERDYLQSLPDRRQVWLCIFQEMLRDELFTRTLHLDADMLQVGAEEVVVVGKIFLHKPRKPQKSA